MYNKHEFVNYSLPCEEKKRTKKQKAELTQPFSLEKVNLLDLKTNTNLNYTLISDIVRKKFRNYELGEAR